MFSITKREIKVMSLMHVIGDLETISVLAGEPDSH